MSATTYYLAGPMRGHQNLNYPAFNATAKCLRECLGLTILNPAENFGGSQDIAFEVCMQEDLKQVLSADGVILLPGWEYSEGARLEVAVALATDKGLFWLNRVRGSTSLVHGCWQPSWLTHDDAQYVLRTSDVATAEGVRE